MKNIENELINHKFLKYSISSFILKKKDCNCILQNFRYKYFIYFIINKNKIIYIGRSKNIYQRITSHKINKEFEYVIFIEYKKEQIPLVEKYAIKTFKPKYNFNWIN